MHGPLCAQPPRRYPYPHDRVNEHSLEGRGSLGAQPVLRPPSVPPTDGRGCQRASKCPLQRPPAEVFPEPVPDLLNAAAPRASLLSKDAVIPSSWLQAISVPLSGPRKGKDVVSDGQLLCKVLW